ncbi:MAG: hypothetical protein ACI9IP_000131 [Arcticibacterium sp.]|jgi:hypothetical protein
MNSIKNKEPNAIDELFQRKLGNYTVEPSAEIREKFLFQINQKKKARPIWYFSAAASVIFACGLGWFLYAIPSGNTHAPEVAINTELNTPVRGSNISIDSDERSKEQSVSQLASNSDATTESIKAPSVKEVVERPIAYKAMEVLKIQIPERSITGVVEMDEPIQDILTLALQKLEKRKNKAEKEDIAKNNSLFQKGAGETIIIVTSDIPDESEEDIFIPGINLDSPITMAQATDLGEAMIEEDRSFIAKVFTELRHLKHGEKVELNTLTASKALVSDEDETFFSHETTQLRQRLRWFKGKVSREL